MRSDSELHESMTNLRKDFGAVARDAEALLKATSDIGSEQVQQLRTKAASSLRQARESLNGERISERFRLATQNTDEFVKDHRWSMIGAAAGTGLLIGLLTRRH